MSSTPSPDSLLPEATPAPAPGPAPAARAPRPAGPRPPPREVASEALLRGDDEVLIRHGEQLYRLRRTGLDKLILTK